MTGHSGLFLLEDNDAYSCTVRIMATQEDGSIGRWTREVSISRQGATTTLHGSVTSLGTDLVDTNIGSPTISITANDTNEALTITVTQANYINTRWLAKIEYLKINF